MIQGLYFISSIQVNYMLTLIIQLANIYTNCYLNVYLLELHLMYEKAVKDRFLTFLILFVFCLSFPSLGGQLWYGEGVEYGHHNLHIHDNRIGEDVSEDEHFTVYYDFLTITPSSSVKTCLYVNSYLHINYYPEYYRNLSAIPSVHHSSINRFCSAGLYQLTLTYLI